MAELTDHELLTRFARNGEEAAFATLVTRHVNLVWSAARRFTGDDTLTGEVTQAVFIILAQKAGRLSAQTVLTGWLYQTARLTAANALKENRRRQQREHQAYMEATLTPNETNEAWQQLAPVLDEAMHALRTADRDAVLLRYFENKSLADVGAALGVTEDAARVRVNRALDKLRALLAKQGIKFGATLLATAVVENSVQAAPTALAAKVSVIAAKGVATTTSITTLVKGTLKIMAWTKMNAVIVVGLGVLFVAGMTTITIKEIRSFNNYSKATMSLTGYTNANNRAFIVLSLINRERVPISWHDLWVEREGSAMRLAPIFNPNLPWISSKRLRLAPGDSEIIAVGTPTESGKWRVCRQFSPEGTTNVFTMQSDWFDNTR